MSEGGKVHYLVFDSQTLHEKQNPRVQHNFCLLVCCCIHAHLTRSGFVVSNKTTFYCFISGWKNFVNFIVNDLQGEVTLYFPTSYVPQSSSPYIELFLIRILTGFIF